MDLDFKPPLASEVIVAIQRLIDKHGDLPVGLEDPDTDWIMPIGAEIAKKMIVITSCYRGTPSGCVGPPCDDRE